MLRINHNYAFHILCSYTVHTLGSSTFKLIYSATNSYTQSWSDLQRESTDCKRAMEEEVKRLEGLESLANQTVSECTKVESGSNDLEAKLSHFEENSTSMTPEEAASVSEEIRGQLEALQGVLSQQAPLVEQLKEGNYHSSEEVDKRCGYWHLYSACVCAAMANSFYFCLGRGLTCVFLAVIACSLFLYIPVQSECPELSARVPAPPSGESLISRGGGSSGDHLRKQVGGPRTMAGHIREVLEQPKHSCADWRPQGWCRLHALLH